MDFAVGYGASYDSSAKVGRHVVALYESVNSTWDKTRTPTGTPSNFSYNLTSGHNFLRIYDNRTVGQIFQSFLNTSWENPGESGDTAWFGRELQQTPDVSYLTYNMTEFYVSIYNNTANSWTIDAIYNWSWNNNTYVANNTPYEVAWVYSEYNLTWNGSSIIANWTVPTKS
jgi:hypothetical protein